MYILSRHSIVSSVLGQKLVHSHILGSYKYIYIYILGFTQRISRLDQNQTKIKHSYTWVFHSDYRLAFSFKYVGERLVEGTNKLYLGGDNKIDSCLVGWRLGLCVGEYCLLVACERY